MSHRSWQLCLWDARRAAQAVPRFVEGKRYEDYLSDELLRLAIERQMITVGEAIRAALAIDPSLSHHIPDASQIIAFRNRIVHGYFDVSNETVWDVVVNQLPSLIATIERLLPDDPVNPLASS